MKRYQFTWLLFLIVLFAIVLLTEGVEGKVNEESEIFLPFISAPAGKWIAAYQWAYYDYEGRTLGLLEIGNNQYKLIGNEFVIYLKGDGKVDRAAFVTAAGGADAFIPLSEGRYVIGAEIWSDHCELKAALFGEDDSTLWNRMVSLKGVDCGGGYNLSAGGDSIYLHHMFNNQRVSGYSSWLVRLDEKGDLAWSKLVGQDWLVGPFAMTTTAEGGLVFTALRNGDIPTIILAELNKSGQLERAREFRPSSGSIYYVADAIVRTASQEYILVGSSSEGHFWALKLDKDWKVSWQRHYKISLLPPGVLINLAIGLHDKGFLLGGILGANGNSYLLRIHSDGSLAWMRTFGSQQRRISLNGVNEAGDGSILVAASLQGDSTNYPLSMKLGPDGLVANCDLIRNEKIEVNELNLVASPTTVAMQGITAELQALDPGNMGPIEAGFDVLCSSGVTTSCEERGKQFLIGASKALDPATIANR